ncbi:MAG: carboxymuconolactone decarboxylase family protein [Gammaproteobacteria bacterium]|nr:carboxymuconolactone decarboxylase family protein [Gammaproteobacteria bacterium]MBU1480384.1 carboxymuconolactone decarboxylase family protein [Gammaproteobacteria bacterium]
MSKSFKELIQHLNPPLATFRKEAAATMTGFDAMSKAAMTAGTVSALDKELIATAIAVATRCEGCIAYHVRTLVRLGVTREQLNEVLAVAVYMGGGPSLMYAGEVMHAFEEFRQQ